MPALYLYLEPKIKIVKNLNVKQKKLLLIGLAFFIVIGSMTFVKTDYYFMSPGPPYQWDIEYGNIENYEFDGNLFQLTVRRDEANALIYAWSYLDNSVDLYPREVILPKGVTPEELSQISIQNMKTSENVAIAVALTYIGYDIGSKGDGVSVVGILDDSPVKDKLLKGDVLNSINGEEISSATEFIATLRRYQIGDFVTIGLERDFDGETKNIEVETKLIEHIELVLELLDFYDHQNPKQVPARLRRLIKRMQLDKLEIGILRGILSNLEERLNK